MLPSRYTKFVDVPKKYGPQADKAAAYFNMGDKLADDLVALFSELPRSHVQKMLDTALDKGIGAVKHPPEAMRAFFAHVEDTPFWLNVDLLDLASRTHLRCGVAWFVILGAAALPMAYLSGPGSKPIAFTGQFLQRSIRRLTETNIFLFETCKPGGLSRNGGGWKTTVKVRLMHAQMRRYLTRSKDKAWKQEEWGVPINQLDMAATQLLLSASFLHHQRGVGFHFSADESEAVMHLWRYGGYLLGIEPELLCATETEGRKLQGLLLDMNYDPDEDSINLAAALMTKAMPALIMAMLPWVIPAGDTPGKDKTRGWLANFASDVLQLLGLPLRKVANKTRVTNFCFGLSRGMLGDKFASELHYPPTVWRWTAPMMFRSVIFPLEFFRRLVPGGTDFVVSAGRSQIERLMKTDLYSRRGPSRESK